MPHRSVSILRGGTRNPRNTAANFDRTNVFRDFKWLSLNNGIKGIPELLYTIVRPVHTVCSVMRAQSISAIALSNFRTMTGPECQARVTKGSEMIVSTTRITVHPDKRGEFFQTVKRLVEPINAAKGCRTFRLYFDATDENSSLLLGEWENEVDLSNYLRSNDFAILRGALTVLSAQYTNFHGMVASSKDQFEFVLSR